MYVVIHLTLLSWSWYMMYPLCIVCSCIKRYHIVPFKQASRRFDPSNHDIYSVGRHHIIIVSRNVNAYWHLQDRYDYDYVCALSIDACGIYLPCGYYFSSTIVLFMLCSCYLRIGSVLQVDGADGYQRLKSKVLSGHLGVLYQGTLATIAATFIGHYPW